MEVSAEVHKMNKFTIYNTVFYFQVEVGDEVLVRLSLIEGIINRGGSRDFEKGWCSMSATMVGRRRKFWVSDGLKRPK